MIGSDAAQWELVVAALAGRKIVLVDSDDDRAYCDGERIHVAIHGDAPVHDTLVVQAAMIAIGSLNPRVVARLAGRRRVRHRYLMLEAARACRVLGDVMPRRVQARIAALYGGPVPDSPQDSLALAQSKDDSVAEAPPWMGTIRPTKLMLSAGIGGGGLDESQRETAIEQPEMDSADEDTERTDDDGGLDAPSTTNRLVQWLAKSLGTGSPSPDETGGVNDSPVGSRSAGRVSADAEAVDADLDVDPASGMRAVGRLYPEYDLGQGGYRHDWCVVTEYDPRPAPHEPRLDVTDDRRLRRELARLGLTHERHRREAEGDALDISSLIEHVLERRAGGTPDPRVYELQRKTAHDLGVLVLLDASGSTNEVDDTDTVFEQQREIAARLTLTFEELGDRVGAYAFQSWGRNQVEVLRIKRFDDRYDHAAQERLASLEPGGFTRLGAAIRHATYLLSNKAGTANTLLIVVGDGLPFDHGYEERYAQEDCRRALAEAVAAGVASACVSVRSSTDPAVIQSVWGHVPHRSLDAASDLSLHAAPLFLGALKEAAASRRVVSADAGRTREAA